MDSYKRSGSFVLYNRVLHPVLTAFPAYILTAPYSQLLLLVPILVFFFSFLSFLDFVYFLVFPLFLFSFFSTFSPSSSSSSSPSSSRPPLLFRLFSSSLSLLFFVPLLSSVTTQEASGSDSSGDRHNSQLTTTCRA